MDRELKIVLIAVAAIFLLDLIVLNTGTTGYGVMENKITKLTITPDKISAGTKINVTLEPGASGAYWYVTFYEAKVNINMGKTNKFCYNGFKCKGFNSKTISYVVGTDWAPGLYYGQIYDYYSNQYIKTYFEVI